MGVAVRQCRLSEDIRCDRLRNVTKRAEMVTRRQVFDELCSKIVSARNQSGSGRILYGLVSNLVTEVTLVCSWINRDVIMNHYRSLSLMYRRHPCHLQLINTFILKITPSVSLRLVQRVDNILD